MYAFVRRRLKRLFFVDHDRFSGRFQARLSLTRWFRCIFFFGRIRIHMYSLIRMNRTNILVSLENVIMHLFSIYRERSSA